MDEKQINGTEVPAAETESVEQPVTTKQDESTEAAPKKKTTCKDAKHKKTSKLMTKKKNSASTKKNKSIPADDSSDESSSDDSSDSSSSESSEDESDESSSSEEEVKKKKSKSKTAKKSKDKKRKKSKKPDSSESEDDSGDESDSSSEDEASKKKQKKAGKKAKKSKKAAASSSDSEDASDDDGVSGLELQVKELTSKIAALKTSSKSSKSSKSRKTRKTSSKFKRVDQLWDSETHNYKLKESAEDEEGEFAEFAFLVRRTFNWENRYEDTIVDIKSKALRTVLAQVMKGCKSVSLEVDEPSLDPKQLFLYLEDLRSHYKKTLRAQIKSEKKRKQIKKLGEQRQCCRTLVAYLDEDFAETKKTLYPLLAAGNITFDLVWALFKPNQVAITSCYGSWDEPRCIKAHFATFNCNMTRGQWYIIEGNYVECDGTRFGYGDFEAEIDGFKGPKKISSLPIYPLKYHPDVKAVKEKIIARGRRFVEMHGIKYMFHKGMAFHKKKKQVLRISINGRVMVDPQTFRRINPNYPVSPIFKRSQDDLESDSDEDDGCNCCESDDEAAVQGDTHRSNTHDGGDDAPKYKYRWEKDKDGDEQYVAVEVDADGDELHVQPAVQELEYSSSQRRTYTDEELLLTSPVVLGFSFNEKLWVEFTISGLKDITYNDQAFDSLVLPGDQKSTVRALVESHKYHAAQTIDDVVQGKGRGLVFVLHGPPGTGKTLTAEGISELLRVPLYIVSAGELGTDPAKLEFELQKILDIAHSWGALLLLDEADVFLEKREIHDIHRNALVSIFLRLLEYFQGILFLTTNRVETFDDAFQSRIHVALRYDELTTAAKKEVWKNFLGMPLFTEKDFAMLARHRLNGRQIKNSVRTSQALALNEGSQLTLAHITRVLAVAETFERDLKGGLGYEEAMRTYT
ncbi:uncharacterized protein MYCGRDRAFT_87870 [Zymoseptoria tritici IPO323]|uniref:AAA+ ATPase domain-containing protein n=1 Tax=Zymoseptoria tritici (strain CBS 115943 / IPO323) TaxID=336722 RepID=F9XLU4_ZYMTI|nr:uncharacterized protein MYCGRDRAFT_87870 [Zymoseptoria tritici IPO323]EGP83924.1 hypothetical protein MYCGRDRAFT_87870 [Zymoseptoria tritici IPO323]